ncbi:DNA repair protein rhp57 [Rhizina undulata]
MDFPSISPGFPIDSPENAPLFKLFNEYPMNTIDVITLEPREIQKVIRGTDITVAQFKRIARDMVTAMNAWTITTEQTGIEAMEEQMKSILSFGDPVLDDLFCGGLPVGHIVEFVGEGGTGKTQLLLQLLIRTQLPQELGGLGRPGVYISTEGPINTNRLTQLANYYAALYPHLENPPSTDTVFTATCNDVQSQEETIHLELLRLVEKHRPGIVVVDSVAANFRAEYRYTKRPPYNPFRPYTTNPNKATFDERDGKAIGIAHTLRQLAIEYKFVVAVANQVGDRFGKKEKRKEIRPYLHNMLRRHQMPAMGTFDPYQLPPSVCRNPFDKTQYSGWPNMVDEFGNAKDPSLAHPWTEELSTRVVLRRREVAKVNETAEGCIDGLSLLDVRFDRRMGIVFSSFAAAGVDCALDFYEGGVRGIRLDDRGNDKGKARAN